MTCSRPRPGDAGAGHDPQRVACSAASSAAMHSTARWASRISAAVTPVRSSCTASASANRRGLPRATRAPPPLPMRISAMPSASQRAQRIARDDAAHAEPRRQILLGAEELAGLQPPGEQVVAHLGDDLRRQRSAATGEKVTPCVRDVWRLDAHAASSGHNCSGGRKDSKDTILWGLRRERPSTRDRIPARPCRRGRAAADDRSPRCRCRRRMCRPAPGRRR